MDILDNPLVQSILFYPRPDQAGGSVLPNVYDGTMPVEEGVVLGYRLYAYKPGAPVILYFHGNGEIASDHDFVARNYHAAGASLLVVDYRGYGWSTGKPKVSALLADVQPVLDVLPGVLKQAALSDQSLVVMGRSLGSATAIHAAHTYPSRFRGVIIESGFAHVIPLLARLGLPSGMLANLPDPIGNVRKIAEVNLPLLVIHGEEDNLIPVNNGQALFEASPASHKRIVRIPGAGHNDLLMSGIRAYFAAITEFLAAVAPPEENHS
jgi:alpha-beta hydrolase superfamily lysophospholipase